jgi:hypothetical protein
MNEEKMLREDTDSMSYEEVLDNLRCFQDLSRFDANTGETETLYHMKTCSNPLNYPLYVAVNKCIKLVESKLRCLGDDLSISQDVEIFKRAYEKYLKDEDPVNSPSHYNDGKIDVIDYIEDKKLGFCLGNAIKYISRAGKKDPEKEVEDLNKAIWYINRRIKEVREVE